MSGLSEGGADLVVLGAMYVLVHLGRYCRAHARVDCMMHPPWLKQE